MASKTPYLYRTLFEELGIIRENVTQFSFGAPSVRMLAKLSPLLSEASRIRMETENGQMFQYGAKRGDPLFVNELSNFLTKEYDDAVDSDDLVCTGGASIGLHLVASLIFKPGDYVFVEDPTYFHAHKILSDDLDMNVVSVPMDDDHTVNVDAFDQLLTECSDKLCKTNEMRPYGAMFYTIPVFHNPTTTSLSPEKCGALIKVFRKHNILAMCDDVYNLIRFGEHSSPRRLFSYDKKTDSDYKGHVVSNGTFSKMIGPGMRTGWIEGPQNVVKKIIESNLFVSGGGVNQYTSAILGTALQTGILSGYIKTLIQELQSKMEVMCQALDQHMKPFKMKYEKPKGGYFIWIEFAVDFDVQAFQRHCIKNYKVSFQPGEHFSIHGNFKNCIRLSFAYVEKDEIDKRRKHCLQLVQ